MKRPIILTLAWLALVAATAQEAFPDLAKAEDLQRLGKGRIIEKDNCIIKDIFLKKVNASWIVYIKNESLHDKALDYIKRLEFPESKWGVVKIEFPGNKAAVSITPCNKW